MYNEPCIEHTPQGVQLVSPLSGRHEQLYCQVVFPASTSRLRHQNPATFLPGVLSGTAKYLQSPVLELQLHVALSSAEPSARSNNRQGSQRSSEYMLLLHLLLLLLLCDPGSLQGIRSGPKV